nr:hypothetical protein [Tanacetum cinerariifolium]
MTKAKDQRSQSMKEQAYNVDRDKDHKSLTTKAISLISRRSVTMNSLRWRFEDKLPFLEQPIPVLPVPPEGQANPLDVVTMRQACFKA